MIEKKNKILILKSDKDNFERFYIKNMQTENIKTVPIYRVNDGIMWKILWLWQEILELPLYWIWYGKWKESLRQYDTLILFDSNLNWRIIRYIKSKNSRIRIIAWYWNNITKNKQLIPSELKELCEIWSFDIGDCEKYGFRYNTQFYFENLRNENVKYTQDVLFVGKDKKRYNIIIEIEKELKEIGVETEFRIIRDKTSSFENKYSVAIEYEELLEKIVYSKAILDVPQSKQSGMTVRVLESVFFRKKLITTDTNISNEEYYDEKNMYIWGKDKRNLKEFLDKPYVENSINNQLRKSYLFNNWIKRFEQ